MNDSRFLREQHTHDIETKPIERNLRLARVPSGRSDQVGSFVAVDRLFGKTEVGRSAGLDLNDDQTRSVPGDQIQFA